MRLDKRGQGGGRTDSSGQPLARMCVTVDVRVHGMHTCVYQEKQAGPRFPFFLFLTMMPLALGE